MSPDVLQEIVGYMAGSISLFAGDEDDSLGGRIYNGEDHVIAGPGDWERAGEIPGDCLPSALGDFVWFQETVRCVSCDLVSLAGIAALDVTINVLVQVGPVVVPSDARGGSFPVVVDGWTVVMGHGNDELSEDLGYEQAGAFLVKVI